MDNRLIFFSDSSYDNKKKIGVIGWCIDKKPVNLSIIKSNNTIECECQAFINVLEYIDNFFDINCIYTIYIDCICIINKINKKDKIIKKNFLKKNGEYMSNYKLYQRIFSLLDSIENKNIMNNKLNIIHIDGHKRSIYRNDIDKEFQLVDRSTRKLLRETIKNNFE